MADRPKVGPADPETRRKFLRAALDEPSRATGVANKPAKPKAKKKMTLADALNPRVKRDRAVGGNDESVDGYVDRAVKGAPAPGFD